MARSLLTIIDDILDFFRIEAGRLDLERIDFGMQPSEEETVGFVAFRAGLKSIELACDFRPQIPQLCMAIPLACGRSCSISWAMP